MRVSAKGRYALAAMLHMAQRADTGEYITVVSISQRMGISKIYLEQVFSLLKRGELVHSVKGAQGGYQLSRRPEEITAYDILSAVELTLFEQAEETVKDKAPQVDRAMQAAIFSPLQEVVQSFLRGVTLSDLQREAEKQNAEGLMFYI